MQMAVACHLSAQATRPQSGYNGIVLLNSIGSGRTCCAVEPPLTGNER